MKIVAISDTHRKYRQVRVPDGDVLIHSGDVDLWNGDDVFDFCEWFEAQPHSYKILVPGNHDKVAFEKEMIKRMFNGDMNYLVDSGCTIEGKVFWGSPYTPVFMNWFFMANRGDDIKKHWDKMPENVDVLVTHGPPYGILDEVLVGYGDHHKGCEELLKRVMEVKPKVHIFGHIHCGYGVEIVKKIKFVNASVLDEDYQIHNDPVVIEV